MKAHSITRSLALVLLLAAGAASADTTLHLELNTSTLSGGGFLDLQFNPGSDDALPATLTISNLVGFDFATAPEILGDVAAVAGGYRFRNAPGINDLFHAVNYGGAISFDLTFAGDVGASYSRFGIAAFTGDGALAAGTADNPFLATVDLLPGVAGAAIVQPTVYVPALATIAAVPEPSSWLMLGIGALLVGGAARRRATERLG